MVNKPGAAASKKAAADSAGPGRLKQIGMVAGIIRKTNPKALPIVAATGIGIIAIAVVIGLLTGLAAFLIPLGVLAGLTAALVLFRRLAPSAQYATLPRPPRAPPALLP